MFRLPNRSSKKGFTLIELLITISIIAIISAIGLVSYSQAQVIARDARRKQDLKAIATALELYFQQNGRYPCSSWQYSSSATQNPWIYDQTISGTCDSSKPNLTSSYINILPKDPKNLGTNIYAANNYVYAYWASTPTGCTVSMGGYYILAAQLENSSDSDTLANANTRGVGPKDCAGVSLTTSTITGAALRANTYVVSNY